MSDYIAYKDASLPVEKRVDDLIARMTTEEKVGQLVQLDGREDMEKKLKEQHLGSFLQILGKDCQRAIELARETRLGIPLLLGVDSIHGYSFWEGATIFPTQLGAAGSWDESVMRDMAEVTAKEMEHTGPNWTFSPVLCITRDLRWGRVGETFGEDPHLIGRFAAAMIKGYQGDELNASTDKLLACAKHYAGYSETHGGRDASEADISPRKLKSYFLPPFKKAVEAGVGSFMTGYQSIEGVPSTANRWLLTENLKEDWGFNGFVVTDWNNVGHMVRAQQICADFEDAAALAVRCGNDMMMSTPEFFQGCLDALKSGRITMAEVEEHVRRILTIKFKLGLFENDRPIDLEKAAKVIGSKAHRDKALRACRESLVLLENNGILPLKDTGFKTIAVVGPNSNNVLTQCGDWSRGTGQAGIRAPHPRDTVVTAFDGISKRFGGNTLQADGCTGNDKEDGSLMADAEKVIAAADLVVAVVGDQVGYWGEWHSTATLELQGGQQELLRKVKASGKPYIIVMLSSKPMTFPEDVRQGAAAVFQQFSPGMLGGQALAEAIFGDINPSGRLTVSIPYHVGQQPIMYMQVRGQHGDKYADLTQSPLYAFGEGIGYGKVEYTAASIDKETYMRSETVKVNVKLKNTGDREIAEVVQIYVSDLVTSATWVDKELKAFERIELKAGEEKELSFEIPVAECSIVNAAGERVVENGEFEVLVGRSSRDFPFRLKFNVN